MFSTLDTSECIITCITLIFLTKYNTKNMQKNYFHIFTTYPSIILKLIHIFYCQKLFEFN